MAGAPLLHIDGLRVERSGATGAGPAIDGLSLRVERGETHVVVGLPGSGRSALAPALLGAPEVRITAGHIRFRGDDITTWPTDIRAKAGLFLAGSDRRPPPGVTLLQLLSRAVGAREGAITGVPELTRALDRWAARLGLDPSLLDRQLDDGRGGADRRRIDLLQLAVLEPELVVIDEPSPDLSGEVVNALVDGLATVRGERPALGSLASTECHRLLDRLRPGQVHVMAGGRIVATGGPELATRLETEGYESFT